MSKNNELVGIGNTQDMFDMASYLIDKKLVPTSIKKPEDVVAIINMGKQLGMEPQVALNSMNLIQGNIALKASVVPGLLATAGIATEVIKDYEPVMKKTPAYLKDKDGNILPADESGNFKYYRNPDGSVVMKEEQVMVDGHPEFVTTVRFHRFYKDIGKTISTDYSFYWSWAVKTQWHTKD